MTKKLPFLFVLSGLILSSCGGTSLSESSSVDDSISSSTVQKENKKVFVAYSGNTSDPFSAMRYVDALTSFNVRDGYTYTAVGYDSFNDDEYNISEFVSTITAQKYDHYIVLGSEANSLFAKTMKTYQGYKFICIDSGNTETYINQYKIEFDKEEHGYALAYLGERASRDKKIGYLGKYYSSNELPFLYGYLQYFASTKKNIKLYPKYIEEDANSYKTTAYVNKLVNDYKIDSLTELSGANLSAILETIRGIPLINGEIDPLSVLDSRENTGTIKASIVKNYTKLLLNVEEDLKNVSSLYGSTKEVGFDDGILEIKNDSISLDGFLDDVIIKDYSSDNIEEFKTLYNTYVVEDTTYEIKESLFNTYHEAVPQCSDLNDWKYAPRVGAENGAKPSHWKALGVWSTIYAQENFPRVSNTGIEFKNMRLYGYSTTKGWVLIEHANPVGSFYDENFTNDASKDFSTNIYNFRDEKRTRILLNSNTNGYNYHPFGIQNDLERIDMLDIKYVLSTMDIRLVKWNDNKPDDMDDAKYTANIGGDWWSYQGATWQPDWSANRDVAVGQFRTITKSWKRLFMCSVPLDLYDDIVGDASFIEG